MQSSRSLVPVSVPVFSDATTRVTLSTENGFYANHQIFWGVALKICRHPTLNAALTMSCSDSTVTKMILLLETSCRAVPPLACHSYPEG